MDKSDKTLLFRRIAEGNKKAFNLFFEIYYPKLVQFSKLFIRSDQSAEDVVSEVLTNILIKRHEVFTQIHFEEYLYKAVKNASLTLIRKNKLKATYTQKELEKQNNSFEFANPHHILVEEEFKVLIYRVIESLPPKRKMVFRLVREDKLSYSEVATLLDISERTVEGHLRLAVKALRQRIEEYLKHDIMHLTEN